jgi:hypothetical protein
MLHAGHEVSEQLPEPVPVIPVPPRRPPPVVLLPVLPPRPIG